MARNKGRRPADPREPTSAARSTPPGGAAAGERANGAAAAASGAPAAAISAAAGAASPSGGRPGASSSGAPAGKPGSAPAGASSGAPPAGVRPPTAGDEPSARSRPPTAPPPPPGGSHRSFRNGAIGGLIGGLVGGVAVWLALTQLPPPEADAELQTLGGEVEQLQSRVGSLQDDRQALAQLSSRVQALEQTPPAAAADLAARVQALETAGATASDQAQAGPALGALEERVGALEQSVSAAEGDAGAGRVEDLRTRLAGLESQLAGLATDLAGAGDAAAGERATLEALDSRLSAIESSLAETGAGGGLAERVDALGARVDGLQTSGARLEQLAGDLGQVKEQSAAAQSRLEQITGQVQGLEGQIQALRGDLDGLENRAASAGDRRELAAALALITTQIDTAIGRGQAYEAPLRSLTALGDQDEVVRQAAAVLAPGAPTGVPSLGALRQSFAPVAGEIVQRERAPEGDSLIDQATSNLLRLVTVRPVGGDVEGEGAAARVARAEAALERGDLAAAVAELEAVDGPAAEPAAGWLAEAKSRLRATTALARLQAHTTELLTPTTE